MPLISEKYHKDKLNKLNINIKTKYIVYKQKKQTGKVKEWTAVR